MPHEKGHLSPVTDTGAVAVDHRDVMTITSDGKLDNCHIINPLKIPKRKGLFDDSTDTNKANGGRKRPNFRKIHWTRLRPNRVSSNSAHRHNGRQADDKNVLANLDIKRRQVKVILTDVLQTEDGQRYLSDCKSDITAKTQTTHQRGSRRRERGLSTEQSRVRRRSSAPCKDQTNLSSIKLINSPSSKNDSVENDMQPSNELQSPAAKKIKRFNNSLKQPEHTAPDWEESYSFKQSHSLASKECQNLLPEHTASSDAAENILCPVEKSDSPMPTSVSPLHSEQISESVNTATDTPSKTKQPGGFQITEYQDSESEAVLTQQNPSEIESQECAEVMKEKEGAIELESEKEEPQQQKGTVADEEGGTRGSVLRLSIGVTEDHLSDGEVTAKSSQTADSADKQLLNSELVEVKQTSKSQTTEPIVLSSEEEEDREDNGTKHVQAVEGDKELHKQQQPVQAMEWKKLPNVHICSSDLNRQDSSFKSSTLSVCPVMELPFSALFMGSFSAFNNGLVKITDDKITISFKDSLGTEVKAFLATAHVLKYSVWDGLLLRDSRLVKENEPPPPSILVLWLADVQAQRLSSELSVVQPGTCADVDSTCVLLCVHEPLNGIQGALLASIMDIVGLRHGNTELMSPLTYSDSLKILQDSHTLKLLLPRVETHPVSCESGAMPASSNTTTTSAKDLESQPDSGVYTVCQSRGQTVYSVSLAHKPAKDWTQYRHSGPARRLIQFPPPPSKGAITVTTEDLECLDSGEFLNDVIIDFYLKYLLVQKAPQASMRRSHIFSSFFFKQLTRRDNANEDSTSTPAQLRRHQRVRTWTRHVDIFEKDFLFVPVNQEAHWYLVVVCFPGLDEPQYSERGGHASVHDGDKNSTNDMTQSESHHGNGELNSDVISTRSSSAPCLPTCTESTCKQQTVCKRPCILIMDSLKLSVHERIFKILREYLQAEWEVKRGGNRDFSADRMVGSHCKVPLQDNSSDCGLYLLQYAESFLQDPVVHFDLPLKLECWFPRQKVREKRENIRDLVLHLYRFQQDSLGSDSLEDGKEMGNIV